MQISEFSNRDMDIQSLTNEAIKTVDQFEPSSH